MQRNLGKKTNMGAVPGDVGMDVKISMMTSLDPIEIKFSKNHSQWIDTPAIKVYRKIIHTKAQKRWRRNAQKQIAAELDMD